jgi:cytochrome c-type biogenesis protein CcsB
LPAFTQRASADDAPVAAPAASPKKGWDFTEAGLIPVQSGGRVKPLDSFARESVLFETGSRSFQGWEPLDLLFAWIALPHAWDDVQFIVITRGDVKRQLGLEEHRGRFSPRELYNNSALLQYAQTTPQGQAVDPKSQQALQSVNGKPDAREQELKQLLERLGFFRSIVSGDAWLVIPKPVPAAWTSLAGHDDAGEPVRARFVDLLKAYQSGDNATFDQAAKLARSAIEGGISGWNESAARVIKAESLYNRTRPFLTAWVIYLLAALTWYAGIVGVSGVAAKKKWFSFALVMTYAAMATHIFGIALRCYVAGRPPVTNMYESIMWVSLGVMIFAAILYYLQRQAVIFAVASVLAMLGLVLGDAAPAMMDPGLHPLVPVLRSNYWLTVHVLTITLGYAAFALTYGLANVTLWGYLRKAMGKPLAAARVAQLNQLTYRAMQFGIVLLAAGTILGGIWADYSWGRFWGWDPKEVWALIALLCYLVILHGRFAGYIGQFSFAAWSVVAFSSVVMAWYGVNFVLGVGLHSYGFSNGGFGYVASGVGLQLGFVAVVALLQLRKDSAAQGI